MPSKRNKLLVVLGLLTVAVSKSHNQRFEHAFESSRTSSASNLSANSRQINPIKEDFRPYTTNYKSYLSYYDLENRNNQKPRNIISRRILEDNSNQRPSEEKLASQPRQMLFTKKTGLIHQESSDTSTEIDPNEFHFDSQKVNSEKSAENKNRMIFHRRNGIAPTEKTNPALQNEMKIESNNNTLVKENKQEKDLMKDFEKPSAEKNSTKTSKPRRKKVLRVRIRGQGNNKNNTKSSKDTFKPIEKTKLITVTTTKEPNHAPKLNVPEAKISVSEKERDLKPKVKFPKLTLEKKKFQSNKNTNTSESIVLAEQKSVLVHKKTTSIKQKPILTEKKLILVDKKPILTEKTSKLVEQKPILTEQKPSKSNKPEVKQFVTFYRRSGPKEEIEIEKEEKYSLPEWTSTYKTEDQNKDDNYYLLSFNYKRNKDGELEDSLRLPHVSTHQKPTGNIRENVNFPTKKKQHPTGELNVGHLENVASKNLERQKNVAKANIFRHHNDGYYHSQSGSLSLSGIRENHAKTVDSLDDLSMTDKSFLEKQHPPIVTLKRKQNRKQKEPVWRLQPLEKKITNNERKSTKQNTNYDNTKSFKAEFRDVKPKLGTDETNYYARSFIKLPSGDKVNIGFKPFAQENFKEINVPRKSAPVLENKGDGNYFIHMYKKVGNIEDFQIQTGRIPENTGYLSSLKLSWTDDDRRAKVEEAVDSRSFIPYSSEIITSVEDRKASIIPQPSENVMHYKPYYVDDFISPLKNDKSYYFHTIPILQRRKRSTSETPHMMTHFTIGDPKVKNNYTLKYKPKLKHFSKRMGSIADEEPSTLTGLTQSRNTDVHQSKTLNNQNQKKIPMYYSKPNESRGTKEYKSPSESTYIFNKYEKPSRSDTNIQIFRSYQRPNRNPKQAHNMTYFINGKNEKIKMQKTEKVRTRRMHNPQPKSNYEKNLTESNNFTVSQNVGSQSTNVREYYIEPKKETLTNITNQTNSDSNFKQENVTLEHKKRNNYLLLTNKTNKDTLDPTNTASQDIMSTTVTPIAKRADTVLPKINVELKKLTNLNVNQTNQTDANPDTENKEKISINSTVSLPKRTKMPKSNKTRIIRKKGSSRRKANHASRKAVNVQKGIGNGTFSSQDEKTRTTVKPTRVKLQKTTITPTASTIPYGYKNYIAKIIANYTSQKTSDTHARKMDKNFNIQTKSNKHITKPATITTKVPTTATKHPIQKTNDSNTKADHRSLAASNIQARRINENTDILLKIDKSATKHLGETSINKSPTKKMKLVQKKGDFPTNVDQLQRATNVQLRQIDDNSWFHPQKYADYDNQDYQEVVHHSDEDAYRNKNINDPHHDVHLYTDNAYQDNSVGITPEVQFQWQTPPQSSERNYPAYHAIPKTQFSCKERPPGYYADLETECQVFHVCHGDGVKHSFLCPNSTIFNQRLLVCDWHNKVLCETAESFYDINNQLYKYSAQEERNEDVRTKNNDILPKNQDSSKYFTSLNTKPNTRPVQLNSQYNSEGEDIPLFVVKHFKEKIPNAEFEKPKSVSKSYSAVITKQHDNIDPTDYRYFNKNENTQFYTHPSKSEVLTQNAFADSQRSLKESWNKKEMEKKFKHELSNIPEQDYTYQGATRHKHNPIKHTTYDAHSRSKNQIIIPATNTDDSYYIPNLNQNYDDDDVHVAGRYNDKVIIVNRKKLNPDFDSSESSESTDAGQSALHDSQLRFPQQIKTTIATQPPLSNKDVFQNTRLPLIQKNQNQGQAEVRVPQYIYPLPGIIQNNDGSTKFNYGYRVENPETVNLEKTAHIFKLSPLTSNEDIKTFHLKTENEDKKQLPEERIKLRIQEIKSGVENIGSKVGKILDGTDNTFKNVRIFKLNPDGINGELEEIRLAPFKFEKQSQPRNSKLKEAKREKLDIKVIRDPPEDHNNIHQNLTPNILHNPRNSETKADINSNFQIHADENARPNYKHSNANTIISTPNLPQKITLNTPSNYKILSTHKQATVDNIKNVKQVFSPYDQMIKAVTIQTGSNPTINKVTNLRNSNENINKNPETGPFKVENRLNNQNTEIILPMKNTFSSKPDKKYEIKYIPLIKVDEIPKLRTFDFQNMEPQVQYKKEKSEHFENIYIPKTLHGKHPSDFIYPDKIILQGPKNSLFRAKHVSDYKNNNYNADNIYKKEPIIHRNVNENLFNSKFPTTHNNNQHLSHATSATQKDTNNKNTFVILPKTPNNDIYPNDKSATEKKNYQYYNINTSPPQNPMIQHSNHEHISDCDDSDLLKANNSPLQLGKNGPTHDLVQVDRAKTILNTESDSKISDYPLNENEIKCRETADNANENQHGNSAPEKPFGSVSSPEKNPAAKIIFKELKRPKYAYVPEKAPPKTADESVHITSKPVKLFQLQRNTRPAFVRPITAIPVFPNSPEGRSNYYPSGIIKEMRPVSHYPSQNIKPVGYFHGTQELRQIDQNHRRPIIHHSQERRELRTVTPKRGRKIFRPPVSQIDDNRSLISAPKTTISDKRSKFADIEKAAEMKAMLKLKEQRDNVNYSPVRTGPQGKSVSHHRPKEPVVTSNNSKNSKYSALEREAELKAERMLRSKKKDKQT